MDWPTSLAVHPDRGELFVANDTGDSVIVFRADANGDVAPIRVIKGPKTMVKNPTGRVIRSGPVDAPSPMLSNAHTVAYDSKREQILVAN
jgi:DNA-binding beta-propeller fold protein YncE